MIVFHTEWDAIVNAITAAILAGFGAWIWALRPRTRLTRMLALFAVAHGVLYTYINLVEVLPVGGPAWIADTLLRGALFGAAAWGLLAMGREVLRPLGPGSDRLWKVAVATVGILAVVITGPVLFGLPDSSPLAWVAIAAELFGLATFILGFTALPVVFVWLYRQPLGEDVERTRRNAIVMSNALVLWPALYGIEAAIGGGIGGYLVLIGVVALGLLWLANIGVDPRTAREARDAALLAFALLLIGTVDRLILSDALGYSRAEGPFYGIARLLTVVALSYAVLKHSVLGFDVNLRFAISKSTIAAVFVAVFFVASEAAQQFFGEAFQSSYVGILTAGALVFAIAPLSRLADRIAEKAVPIAEGRPAATTAKEEAYKRALRIALRDRKLTREEDIHVHELAEHLGIGAGRAMALRVEIERELAASTGGGT
ncbi:MAG: hypothetical protein HY556_00775 [Euryarchaeota archaeon]|nr:hypothetical protein [Euryarchaeota archaeon]